MTINSTTSRVSYNGNGSTVAFAVPYYFAANADVVAVIGNANGSFTTLVLNTDYTLTGATSPSGGTLTTTTAPASGATITIYRDPAATQLTHWVDNDPLPAASIENAMDKLTVLAQRVRDVFGRTLRLNDGDPATAVSTLPAAPLRANKYLSFDTNGDPAVTTFDVDTVQAAAAAATAVASSAGTSATAAASSASSAANSATMATTQANLAATTVSAVAPTKVDFSGTGAQTAFTLPSTPPQQSMVDVFIGGVYQNKDQWSIAGSTLNFVTAPPAGTNNIEVKISGTIAAVVNANNADYGLITSSATSFADYGAVI